MRFAAGLHSARMFVAHFPVLIGIELAGSAHHPAHGRHPIRAGELPDGIGHFIRVDGADFFPVAEVAHRASMRSQFEAMARA